MKIVILGNKNARYALILRKLDRNTKISVDNTITYYYSNHLDVLKQLAKDLKEVEAESLFLDINIYDYNECHYV